MKIFHKLLIISCFFLLASCQKQSSTGILIILNTNVIDVKTGEVLTEKDVWIANDRIHKITQHNSVQHNHHTTIDAENKYIIPGLWDMHAHIVDYDWVPNLYTALGVTGLRSMHGRKRIEDVLENRKDGNYKGFEFLYSGPIIDGSKNSWSGAEVALSPEKGREIVRGQHKKGYDFVKIYNYLSFETYMAIADECHRLNFPFAGHVPFSVTTEQAIKVGQKSIEHSVGLEHSLSNPDFFNSRINVTDTTHFENLTLYLDLLLKSFDDSLFSNTLEITKNSKTWFCPTLINWQAFALQNDSTFVHNPRNKYIPKEELDYWKKSLTSQEIPEYLLKSTDTLYKNVDSQYFHLISKSLKPMLNNGTRFLAGTDIGNPYVYPGFSIHDEMSLFVKAGFTELEALQTATLNPAIYADKIDVLGTVEEGKIANLVILDKNPLDNIENTLTINGLIRRGEYLNKEALQKLLEYNKN